MKKTETARFLTLGFFSLLALTVVIWVIGIDDPDRRLTPFLIGILPLLLLVRGILHGKIRTHQIAVFVALPYLIHGSAELFENFSLLPLSETVASLGLMVSASFYAKWTHLSD